MSLTLCILIRFWNNAWSKTLTFSDKSPGVFCLSAHDTTALVFMYTTHIYHVIQQWHRNEPLSTLQLSVNSHYSLHVTLQQKNNNNETCTSSADTTLLLNTALCHHKTQQNCQITRHIIYD